MTLEPIPECIRAITEPAGIEVWDLPVWRMSDEWVHRLREKWGPVRYFAGTVIERDGRIVLIRDAEKESVGGWTIPGGSVELGEDIAAAAVREAKEECGLDVVITRPLAVGATAAVGPTAGRIDYYDVIFEARALGGVLGAADPKEVVEVRWASRQDAEALVAQHGFDNVHPFDRSLFRCIREFFEKCG